MLYKKICFWNKFEELLKSRFTYIFEILFIFSIYENVFYKVKCCLFESSITFLTNCHVLYKFCYFSNKYIS